MDIKSLKTKITKTLKQNGIHKAKIMKSGQVRGYYTILYSGFDYSGNEIRWYKPRTSNEDAKEQINKVYACLESNGFSEFISMNFVGAANIPVINLKCN